MSYDARYPPPPGTYPPPPGRQSWRDERSGLPARPPSPHRPPSHGGGDSYRPYPSSGYNSYAPRDRDERYSDSYGSSRHQLPPPPPPQDYRRDSFRPPQGDFTFRVDKPAGVDDSSYDSYRPGNRQDQRGDAGRRDPRNGRSFRGRDSRRRGDGRPYQRYQKIIPADRPILHANHGGQPVESFADEAEGTVYKAFGDLSDSDEAEMDISDASDDGSAAPAQKRARVTLNQSTSDDSTPKWSNPDPYTALPPPDETRQKKKDVVHLIRKARVQPAKETKASVPTEAEDFIRCDLDSDESEVEENKIGQGVPGAPTGPRAASSSRTASALNGFPSTVAPTSSYTTNNTSSHLPGGPSAPQASDVAGNTSTGNLPPLNTPMKRAVVIDLTSSSDLGTRKRTHDDELKLPSHSKLKKPVMAPVSGNIMRDWLQVKKEDPCPWLMPAAYSNSATSVRLHMEIVDFYEYVKPRQFEDRVRRELVRDIERTIRQRYHDARIDAFGSFMSGLYLPTGDMDLVFCSDRFFKGGPATYNTKRHLWALKKFLETKRVASDNNFEVISKAKVPLVKYIDKLTGLKIDMSFENLTGIHAIETFKAWKQQYPAMPILVTLIKHFLLMRGLNEPVNGGIGGFSVICLVTSMLQLMPQVQSRDLVPEHHLGMLLMEFFDLYGNRFNYKTVAISMNPPGYIPKSQVTGFAYKNPGRLSIIDPNNPENDISGGSSNTEKVMYYFSLAYREIQERMVKTSSSAGESILQVIFAGNYSSFRQQRDHLRKVHEKMYGPCRD